MINPITQIEDEKSNKDMGKMGYQILSGAIEGGATPEEAMQVMIGFFAGMFYGASKANDDNKGQEDGTT